ncbi:MAG: hypothetical protein FLDDKLPJ_00579 [Phycisphaerae bacterium]|nr:hypothetical protein [Phycisphaerae bacterium]
MKNTNKTKPSRVKSAVPETPPRPRASGENREKPAKDAKPGRPTKRSAAPKSAARGVSARPTPSKNRATASTTSGRRAVTPAKSVKRAGTDAPESAPFKPRSRTTIHADILAYNAAQAAGDRRICDALAQAIHRTLTQCGGDGVEHKIWHRHPVWFIDGNPIVGYHKLKDGVRLLFWSGRSFDEPGLAPEGGFQTAGVRYTAVNQISAKDLKRWLAKSVDIQWDYKNLVKRRGRLERLK